ncbi:hypothetical protein F4Z99_18630 [Candidatus Poribacteria bacterium]|nr:hypothetical protein [Candidatus Poribacteria bacterium]MYB01147.1 hypothetical protein [Candidatus Poribacteria bacterium]
MATRDEVLAQYAKLPAFRGLVSADIGVYLDLALEAVEGYAPKKVKMKKIPKRDDARYSVPDGAKTLLGAFVADSNIRIEMREEETPAGERSYLLLQVQVPSWIDLVRDDDVAGYQSYPTPYASGFRYGTYAGSGYASHDLEYTIALTVEALSARQLMALRLYAESQAYEFQATKSENLSDITDRDATGESTTLRRSQSGNAFQKLADRKEQEFKREVARPYWATDSFGLTEYLWSEHRL